ATEVTPPANAGTNPDADLLGISCSSAGNCTAVGEYEDTSNHYQAIVATETGGSFGAATEVTAPANAGTNPDTELGAISCSSVGNCTAVGRYDDSSNHGQAFFVNSVPSLALTTASLPSGTVGRAYSASLSASGGAGSYTYSIVSGTLRRGLSLNSSTGVISGTPKSAGTASITFQVADPGPPVQQASATLSLAIVSPKIVITSKKVVLAGKILKAPVELTCKTALCSGRVELKGKSTKTRTVVLASKRYRLAKGKSRTLDLALTATGRRLLAAVAEKPLHETLVATVTGGRTAKRNVLVS
ncbi:MAG: Ig domain-containing protein, partial [Acidimicrobiales bacterium]